MLGKYEALVWWNDRGRTRIADFASLEGMAERIEREVFAQAARTSGERRPVEIVISIREIETQEPTLTAVDHRAPIQAPRAPL